MESKHLYQIAITALDGVGPVIARNLISYCGSVESVFSSSLQELVRIPGIGKLTAQKLIASRKAALKRAEKELKFLDRNKHIQPIFYLDKDFSNRLKFCSDAPLMVYFNGNVDLNANRMIAVVGTRRMSNYGRKLIETFIEQIAGTGVIVVSGLAYGVDTYVHKVCVQHQVATIGVLAHGLDRIYPATNKKLAKAMVKHGGLISEYTHETNPDRENFPSRNRIIAGLSDATVIIESKKQGGSLITGDLAISYHRDVFAFPGRVNDENSSGCNAFIKQQKALLIEQAGDLFAQLGWEQSIVKKNAQRRLFVDLAENERIIVKALAGTSSSPEEISIKSSLPLSQVNTHLLNLELKGVIRSIPGNLYIVN
ncbi:MAG: DNA-processing protein DprA [Saprospiraceae bacterium]|nr:DNA-processing protein DprA [Saprospiraceae bacterium]